MSSSRAQVATTNSCKSAHPMNRCAGNAAVPCVHLTGSCRSQVLGHADGRSTGGRRFALAGLIVGVLDVPIGVASEGRVAPRCRWHRRQRCRSVHVRLAGGSRRRFWSCGCVPVPLCGANERGPAVAWPLCSRDERSVDAQRQGHGDGWWWRPRCVPMGERRAAGGWSKQRGPGRGDWAGRS